MNKDVSQTFSECRPHLSLFADGFDDVPRFSTPIWKWTAVTGTVQVTQGSPVVKTSHPIPLDPGEPIRIGTRFETTVKEDHDDDEDEEDTFTMATPWNEESASGLKVWKKDYERVFALAKGAYNSTRVQEIQAESLFFLARVYHSQQDNDKHEFIVSSDPWSIQTDRFSIGFAQNSTPHY